MNQSFFLRLIKILADEAANGKAKCRLLPNWFNDDADFLLERNEHE